MKYAATKFNPKVKLCISEDDRCKSCVYLVELNSEWYCDNYQMFCSDIKHCKEIEDE